MPHNIVKLQMRRKIVPDDVQRAHVLGLNKRQRLDANPAEKSLHQTVEKVQFAAVDDD